MLHGPPFNMPLYHHSQRHQCPSQGGTRDQADSEITPQQTGLYRTSRREQTFKIFYNVFLITYVEVIAVKSNPLEDNFYKRFSSCFLSLQNQDSWTQLLSPALPTAMYIPLFIIGNPKGKNQSTSVSIAHTRTVLSKLWYLHFPLLSTIFTECLA
jgi:hypothetical protein